MIVVSNTSPITNLAAIGQFDLLQRLFGELHVSASVFQELAASGVEWAGYNDVKQAAWVAIDEVTDPHLVDALRLDLDRGEAETIVLALQLGADLVLLDERAGRLAAQHFDLKVMGVIGILVRCKQLGYITTIRPLLDELRQRAGFYIDQALYNHALKLALES